MKAKRFLFLWVLVALMILPVVCVAESWENFVDSVEAALKASKEKVVVVTAPSTVNASPSIVYASGRPIRVPEGRGLVIEGGRFEHLALEGGHITLRGVTVHDERYTAISIVNEPLGSNGLGSGECFDVTLVIEEDSVIQSVGEGISIRNKGLHHVVYVENRGTITAKDKVVRVYEGNVALNNSGTLVSNAGPDDHGYGVYINMEPDESSSAIVSVHNTGTIKGLSYGIFAFIGQDIGADSFGCASLRIVNEGKIESDDKGVSIRLVSSNEHTELVFENADQGEITGTITGVELEQWEQSDNKTIGQAHVINKGVVTGGQNAFSIVADYPNLVLELGTGIILTPDVIPAPPEHYEIRQATPEEESEWPPEVGGKVCIRFSEKAWKEISTQNVAFMMDSDSQSTNIPFMVLQINDIEGDNEEGGAHVKEAAFFVDTNTLPADRAYTLWEEEMVQLSVEGAISWKMECLSWTVKWDSEGWIDQNRSPFWPEDTTLVFVTRSTNPF